jgi:hypothetical protein
MFGVNPWDLNAWMGHKSMEETMRYVHVAESRRLEIPKEVVAAGAGEADLRRRVLAMLSARGSANRRGITVASGSDGKNEAEGVRDVA